MDAHPKALNTAKKLTEINPKKGEMHREGVHFRVARPEKPNAPAKNWTRMNV